MKTQICILLISLFVVSCAEQKKHKLEPKMYQTVGEIERLDPALDSVISENAVIEVLSTGHAWSEGPIWLAEEKKLIYTDVGHQKLYQWTEKDSVTLYLDMKDEDPERPGPSALLVDQNDSLVILRYGHGEAVKMKSPITQPKSDFNVFVDNFNGTRFNNTNDATFHSNGTMLMSDPPPVVEGGLSAAVYRISPQKEIQIVTDTLSSPNGIAFSPDEKTVYIANADWQNAIWIAADVDENGSISNGRKFFDATGNAPKEKGHPDGLKVNKDGIIFATGPGGVYVLSPEGKHLGTILNDEFNTNCVLDDTEETIYITSGPKLMRVVLKP
ncbi:SMP-30/gluconolactonase/LRE family protein [Muricauda sp. 2012CJ35-5]|uniref:SMP-30/gluconolactonase/LRE family protein n=1 Tax=Flagellimonas spongiicola TaxID=2942208 RepID=A0ABT0PVK5_9FLAO|nr:SMP-30/gluconolactonase/LRE family protein [Allomuricauda spongiicola]MCL6275415.1 SMP-30/gluconolactonase/LRE family protein [Allomuricauda spongiicola]